MQRSCGSSDHPVGSYFPGALCASGSPLTTARQQPACQLSRAHQQRTALRDDLVGPRYGPVCCRAMLELSGGSARVWERREGTAVCCMHIEASSVLGTVPRRDPGPVRTEEDAQE